NADGRGLRRRRGRHHMHRPGQTAHLFSIGKSKRDSHLRPRCRRIGGGHENPSPADVHGAARSVTTQLGFQVHGESTVPSLSTVTPSDPSLSHLACKKLLERVAGRDLGLKSVRTLLVDSQHPPKNRRRANLCREKLQRNLTTQWWRLRGGNEQLTRGDQPGAGAPQRLCSLQV